MIAALTRYIAFTGVFIFSFFCAAASEAQEAVHSEIPATVTIADGTVHEFQVELALTEEARNRGLMFREELAPNAGMIFLFERPRHASFWMRNTLIPLDIIFIRQNGRIANIVRNVEPQTDTQRLSKGRVKSVLELAGGRARELGIKAGDIVRHPILNQ